RALRPVERRDAGEAHRDEQEQVGRVAEQQEPDEHAREAAFEHREDAERIQHRHHDDERRGDGHGLAPSFARPPVIWRSTSAPSDRSTSSTRPMTTRYTPMSKNVDVTNSMCPITGISASQTARVSGLRPKSMGAAAVDTATSMPRPSM